MRTSAVRAAVGRVVLERTGDGELWDRLVAGHEGSTAFFDWSWLDFVSGVLDVRIERYLVLADGEPVGVFPLARRLGRRAIDSPNVPFPFLGPLVAPALLPATARAVRRPQLAGGLVLARFDVGPSDTGIGTAAALRSAGLEVHEDSTVVVDTSHGSIEALHAGYSRMRKRNVKRAVQSGTVVRPAAPGELAAVLPDVLDEAYRAHGASSPYPPDIGARVEAWSGGQPSVTSWVAVLEGELAGAIVMLGGHPTAIAWVGGCLRHFRDQSPNALLHQVLLETAVERGYAAVDFSGWVDDAVGEYKLGFGGERRPYLSVKSSLVPEAARRGLRRMAGRRHDGPR